MSLISFSLAVIFVIILNVAPIKSMFSGRLVNEVYLTGYIRKLLEV